MYNSSYGRLLRSLVATADSSLPATSKTKSLNHSIPVVPSLNFPSPESKNQPLPLHSLKEYKPSWIRRVLDMSKKFLSNSLTNASQTGDEFSMNANVIPPEDKLTQESSHTFRM